MQKGVKNFWPTVAAGAACSKTREGGGFFDTGETPEVGDDPFVSRRIVIGKGCS